MKKIDIGVVVTTLIIVTISCSLAFFAARVVGNPKDINLVAKNVAITFTDTSSIASNETISPGWNNVKTFTITNNSKEDFSYNIILKGLVNTFESINTLQYKITSDTGYNIANYLNVIKTETSKDVVLAYNITIPKNTIQSYQVEFNYISTEEDQSGDMGKKLGGTLAIETSSGTPEIYDKLLADNQTIKTRTDFSNTYTETNVNTLYKATEDNTDVYYFAGNATNNWVKFGTWNENKSIIVGKTSDKKEYSLFSSISECNTDSTYSTDCEKIILGTKGEDMYWRIIRTNSDGSVRLLYAGTSPSSTNTYIGLSKYTENTSGYLYAGYMYGTSGSIENNRTNENSSTIKTYVDSWYKSNLTSYTKYLSKSAIYCSDRDLANTNLYGGDNVYSDTYGFGFAARDRLSTDFTPNYNCNNTKDSFSANNTEAKLTYPVALMTADEIAFAGGKCHTETKSYFSQNSLDTNSTNYVRWWTMTPTHQTKTIKVKVYDVISISTYGNNVLNDDNDSDYLYAVRPVISIKENAIYKSGDGSSSNPYEIVTE